MSSVVDSLRNPLAIRISSVVDCLRMRDEDEDGGGPGAVPSTIKNKNNTIQYIKFFAIHNQSLPFGDVSLELCCDESLDLPLDLTLSSLMPEDLNVQRHLVFSIRNVFC